MVGDRTVAYSFGLNDSSKYPVTTATETMARGRISRRRRQDCKMPRKAAIWPGGGKCFQIEADIDGYRNLLPVCYLDGQMQMVTE